MVRKQTIAKIDINSCNNIKTSQIQQCWSDKLEQIVRQKGVDAALETVDSLYQNQKDFAQTCHALTHQIGKDTFALYNSGINFKLTTKTAFCAYGFYHGFMEDLIITTNNLKQAQNFCDYVDQQLKNQAADSKLQCYHGIGHGTVGVHNPNIKGDEKALIDPALKLCEQVSTTDDQLYRCASGIFNAIAIYYRTGEYSLPFDKNDPLRLCRQQKDIYKEPCYGNMNTILLWITNNDFAKINKFVEEIPEDKYAIAAEGYMGGIIAMKYVDNLEPLVTVCRKLQSRLYLPCIKGLAHGLMENGKPGIEYVAAFNFCKTGYLKKMEKDNCMTEVITYLDSMYPADKIKSICADLGTEYQKQCYE